MVPVGEKSGGEHRDGVSLPNIIYRADFYSIEIKNEKCFLISK
jgi:hypothetical protein